MKKIFLFFFLICFREANSQNKTIDSLIEKGIQMQDKANYSMALENFQKALNQAQLKKDKKTLKKCFIDIGNVYFRIGDYPKSLDFHAKALHMAEADNDNIGIANCYSVIGVIYSIEGDNSNAITYVTKALKIGEDLQNKTIIASSYNHLGSIYFNMNESDEALNYYKKELKIREDLNIKKDLIPCLGSIGAVYSKMKKHSLALEYCKRQLSLTEEFKDKSSMADALFNIGGILADLKRNKEAMDCFDKTMKIGMETGSAENIRYAYNGILTVYYNTGRFKDAFDSYEKFTKINDSIFNIEKSGQINDIKIKYETEKKESENKLLSQQNKIQSLQLNQNKYFIFGLCGFLLLVFLVAFLLIRQNKLKNQQHEIQLEQKLLRSQMNPHFIFNSLQAIQNFILKQNDKDAVKYLSSFASITRSVLENSRLELIPIKKEVVLLENYLQLQKLRFGMRFNYAIHVDGQIDVENTLIPPMLSQPFIENALEHGMNEIESGGLIDVYITSKNNSLLLEIKDNGKGINFEAAEKKEHQSLATAITKERIALMNKKKMAKIIFSITEAYPDEQRKGVKVSFQIPLQHLTV